MCATDQQVCSALEQIVWIEGFLIMPSQVRPNSFPGGKTHLYSNLGPSPVLTHDVKPALISNQLGTDMICQWANNQKIDPENYTDIDDQPCLTCINPESSVPHEESSGYSLANPKIWQSGPRS